MEQLRQQDADQGLRVAQVLKGFITRKVVKQTVMTVVYGVTRYGGRLQIEKRLRELSNFPQVCSLLGPHQGAPDPEAGSSEQRWSCKARLLGQGEGQPASPAHLPFTPTPRPHRSLSGKPHTTSCAWSSKAYRRCSPAPGPSRCVPPALSRGEYPFTPSPRGLLIQPGVLSNPQHWLTESANLISHTGWPVEWVTPLGIPIIQPYHREAKIQVKGGIQSITLTSSMDFSQKPNTLKQKNGFPPNFIHSLDSSHMMLTALHCYRCVPGGRRHSPGRLRATGTQPVMFSCLGRAGSALLTGDDDMG